MGYVYERNFRTGRLQLCCDVCGRAGARKIPCRYGYCQSTAMCAGCRANPDVRAKQRAWCDENCKHAAEEFARREERKAELLERGAFVRTSAIGREECGLEVVAVTFRAQDGREIVLDVPRNAYRAVPLLEPATPADFGVSALVLEGAPA